MIKAYNLDPALRQKIEQESDDAYAGMGEVFWVSKSGTNFYERLLAKVDRNRIFPTLAAALPATTADQGDVVNIAAGHTETLTGAGGITLSRAGVKWKGWGQYNLRPTFLLDGAAASMLITGAHTELENVVINPGHADLAYCGLITAKGVTLNNVKVGQNTVDENFKIGFSVGAADNDSDGFSAVGCELYSVDAANTGAIVINKDITDASILGNKILGNFGGTPYTPILMPDNEIPLNIEVAYNVIHNQHNANAVVGISILEAVGTGSMHHNYCYALDVAGATPFLAGATGIACFENYYIFEATTSGYLRPAVGTPA